MHLKRRVGVCLLAAAVVAGVAPAGTADAAPAKASPVPAKPVAAKAPASGQTHSVTLITGDRVIVAGGDIRHVSIQPGPGRRGIRFVTSTARGHLSVTPADAVPLVHTGRLDSRLFDVTTLLSFGYDDKRADLPLIVSYAGTADRSALKASSAPGGAAVTRDLPAVNGMAVKESRRTAGAYWQSLTTPAADNRAAASGLRAEVARVWLDGLRQPTLDVSVPLIGAPIAWQAGLTGQAVPVGVVDTGIDDTHPDLAGKVVAAQNFTDDTDTLDKVGHGTHVASTITGSGAASDGKYKGVAPGVKLYSAKVCEDIGCAESWILAGMQWASTDQHAKVVNMSLGGGDTSDVDPLEQAVHTLTQQNGTLFVVAAGNSGGDSTVSSPGSADDALTVGAVTKQEALAVFSSRGPRIGDSALKPDITAPGVDITAARSKDGFLGNPGEAYMTLSGTSMATPHVAGSAAILAGEHPDWTPAQLKAALMASAKPNPAIGVFAQGAGRVDIGRGISQSVVTSPASVSFGLQSWPHNDDPPIAKTVTYQNYGTAPVTLTLSLNTTGPDGKPSAAGLFTLSANTVTVPAGGDADVTVTANTSIAGPDGFAGGDLTATGGDQVVQTPLGVVKEVESYDVTLVHIGRDGQPATQSGSELIGLDDQRFVDAFDPSGTVKLRLPKGRYLLSSMVFAADPEHPELTQLVQPVVDVSRPQNITLDARTAKPISVTTPRPDATSILATVSFSMSTGQGTFSSGVFGPNFDGIFTAQVGDGAKVDGLTGVVGAQFAKVAADGDPTNSPFDYNLAFFDPGRFITGFQRAVGDRDLATVHTGIAAEPSGTDVIANKGAFAELPGGVSSGISAGISYDLPASRTEFYNADHGDRWMSPMDLSQLTTVPGIPFPIPVPVSILESAPTEYRPGHTYRATWNQGVFGPAFPQFPQPAGAWSQRQGDEMLIGLPLYSDGADHAGFSLDTAKLTVFRDGVKVGESDHDSDLFTVPAADGRYRVEESLTREAPFTMSTSTNVVWTFRSGHVAGDKPVALPMSAIRFLPRLDLTNTAPADCWFTLPIDVQRQDGSSAGRVRTLAVQVSFDDGKSWQQVPVLRLPSGWTALLHHPKGRGFVSLKAQSSDVNGNTVEETIVRAYKF